MPNQFKVWSAQEEQALRDAASQGLNLQEAADLIGRPYTAVQVRASRMKIPFPNRLVPAAWTSEEESILLESARDGLTMIQVAELIGRPHSAVKCKASKLGISFSRQAWGQVQKPWTLADDEQLRELAPTTSYTKLASFLDRTEAAIRTRAHIIGAVGRPRDTRFGKGRAHHSWRGGDPGRYRGEDWAEVRRSALERDENTCQDCGLYVPSGRGLVVHHVIPYRLRPKNELRWLVTLCGPDHLRRPEHRWLVIPESVQQLL